MFIPSLRINLIRRKHSMKDETHLVPFNIPMLIKNHFLACNPKDDERTSGSNNETPFDTLTIFIMQYVHTNKELNITHNITKK